MLAWKIAFRNLFRQKSRTLLCGSSICGAFILFSISLGFSDGTYGVIIRMLTENHSGHVQIHHTGFLDTLAPPEFQTGLGAGRSVEAA